MAGCVPESTVITIFRDRDDPPRGCRRRAVGQRAPKFFGRIDRLGSEGPTLSAERLVDGCLELIGNYELLADTHTMLMSHVQEGGPLQTDAPEFAERVGQMLQLIVSTQEYQFT